MEIILGWFTALKLRACQLFQIVGIFHMKNEIPFSYSTHQTSFIKNCFFLSPAAHWVLVLRGGKTEQHWACPLPTVVVPASQRVETKTAQCNLSLPRTDVLTAYSAGQHSQSTISVWDPAVTFVVIIILDLLPGLGWAGLRCVEAVKMSTRQVGIMKKYW